MRWFLFKVVKRLSVNRLPVKLPITGFNFQLPIYPHFSSRCAIFGFSFVSHACRPTKTGLIGPRHTVAVRRLGPVGALPSPRRVAAAAKGGRGRGVFLTFFWPDHCCMHGRQFNVESTATWADFHGLLWVRHPFVGSVPAWPWTSRLK